MGTHDGHRERKRRQFREHGIDAFADHEVLELLLYYAIPRRDVNPIAHALIERFGNLEAVLAAPLEELELVPGMGPGAATLIKLVPQVTRRARISAAAHEKVLDTTERIGAFFLEQFVAQTSEVMYQLCLDAKGKSLGVRRVSEGNLVSSEVNVRRVAEICMALGASYFYLAHNHVSNLAFPSEEDWRATDLVRTALAPLGVSLVDHLIFVDGDAVSLRDTERSGGRKVLKLVGPSPW